MSRFRRTIRRRADGDLDVRLSAQQRELLGTLGDQLHELLGDDEHRPVLRRLSPPAYGDDVVRDAEYQTFMGEELRSSRRKALEVLTATAAAERLDEEQAIAWMQAINAIRLVLGTALDVDEDDGPVSPRHPDAGTYAVYHLLGMLLDELVDALTGPPER